MLAMKRNSASTQIMESQNGDFENSKCNNTEWDANAENEESVINYLLSQKECLTHLIKVLSRYESASFLKILILLNTWKTAGIFFCCVAIHKFAAAIPLTKASVKRTSCSCTLQYVKSIYTVATCNVIVNAFYCSNFK